MKYIDSILVPLLKHSGKQPIVGEKGLGFLLWYTTTTQAYIQRDTSFDNSWFAEKASDTYIQIYLKKVLKVSDLQVFETMDSLEDYLQNLSVVSINDSLLYIFKGKNSLFFDFWDKIRNTIAHGVFNQNNSQWYFLGQAKPKITSKPNFLLQCQASVFNALTNIWTSCLNGLENIDDFRYACLQESLELEKRTDGFYSNAQQRYIAFDDEFKFNEESRESRIWQIQNYLMMKQPHKKMDIIISASVGNIAERNLESKDKNIRIVPQDRILNVYSISGIGRVSRHR